MVQLTIIRMNLQSFTQAKNYYHRSDKHFTRPRGIKDLSEANALFLYGIAVLLQFTAVAVHDSYTPN